MIELNVLSAGLAVGGLVQAGCWLLAGRGLLGDQSNTLLRWDNTDGLSIDSISTTDSISIPRFAFAVGDYIRIVPCR